MSEFLNIVEVNSMFIRFTKTPGLLAMLLVSYFSLASVVANGQDVDASKQDASSIKQVTLIVENMT